MGYLVLALMGVGISPASGLEAALELERGGDDAGALARLEGVLRAQPQAELARLEAARLLLKQGRLDEAEAHLEAARALVPENPRVHYYWGVLKQERGDVEQAASALELAISFRSDFDEARFRLAGLLAARGHHRRAEEHYRHLASHGSGDLTGVRLMLAGSLERQGRADEAVDELLRVFRVKPSAAVAGRVAELYARLGKVKLADKYRRIAEGPTRKMRPLRKSRR